MIVAVGSWRGRGASVAALLIAWSAALADDTGSWLIEADPAGGVLAGRMRLPAHSIGGLEQVAFSADRQPATQTFNAVAHRVPSASGEMRVIAAPVDPFRAASCHLPRTPWLSVLADLGGHVVLDIGIIRAGSLARPLLDAADAVVVVTSPEVSSAVSSSEFVRSGGRVAASERSLEPGRARLLVVESPGGVAFPTAQLVGELGDQCIGSLPWDPAAVDAVHLGAAATDRRLRRSPLVSAARNLTSNLLDRPVPSGAFA